MDPRYSRQLSPPRRYAHAARNSTGRLDADYESYYQPRGSRESIIVGPRTSAERIVPRGEGRLVPLSRSSRDDYYVPSRYAEPVQGDRRPPNIITQGAPPTRYKPVISSAVDLPSNVYGRLRPRDDESYYIQPASSSGHSRHVSVGSGEMPRYASDVDRDRERARPAYKSSGLRRMEYLSPTLPVRDPRDRRERGNGGYEHTAPREEAYYDTAPKARTRRVSDLGSRDRPTGLSGGADDNRRQQGPPVTTRGLAKIEDDGLVRREYRYPRDEPSSTASPRESREERDRLRPSRGLVAVHQDEGYSSNVDDHSRDKSHQHKPRDSVDRDRYADVERRVDEQPVKKYHQTEPEDRRTRHHRADSEDRHHKPQRYSREDSEEIRTPRDDEDKERRRRGDEPRKDKHDERRLVEGLAIGAVGVGAAGVIAESLKPKHEKDGSDLDSEAKKERPRRRRHREEADGERGVAVGGEEAGKEDRRERRRRNRREREEGDDRERRERGELIGPPGSREEDPRDRSSRIVPVAGLREATNDGKDGRPDEGEERTLRRRRRRHRQRTSSSDTDSSDDEGDDQTRVRVVSPARDSDIKPKSILRLPTQKFPEDLAPIREGVAPLKDAGKKGIPVNARWTKIDRRLVNPEALELGNERYESRPENVIVLRVLTKEEIEKYATITQELRCKF